MNMKFQESYRGSFFIGERKAVGLIEDLKTVRCRKCKKLLGKVSGEAEIKCARCGTTNTFKK